ncbi:MAG TPA: hypothetical protein VHL80_05955 [Polyangia bacterium]|nr:hypothetical protein [Polyangia bacterium]
MSEVDVEQPRAGAAGRLRNSRPGGGRIGPPSRAALAGLALAAASIAASCGQASGGPPAPTSACAASTKPTSPPPYAVEFRFRNDGPSSLFVLKSCGGYDFGVSWCGTGFTDRLNDPVVCECSCDDPQCGKVCGQCAPDEGTEIAAGASLDRPWSGISTTLAPSAAGQCVVSRDLGAGRYRVSIWVYDTAAGALARARPRVVSLDFELPAPSGIVDVPLAPSPDDVCDPTPDAPVPVCTGGEPHDTPCGLASGLTFASEGGLALSYDSETLTPPATDVRSRRGSGMTTPFATCSTQLPRCSRDARVATTRDLTRALAQPDVAASFGADTPVFGSDPRGSDGSITVVTRPDGTSVGLGEPCFSTVCDHPLTSAFQTLESVLARISEQQLSDPTCAALPTSPP